jgi:two-component system NtrC family sensor kinase
MKSLCKFVSRSEDWIIARILSYAKRRKNTKYSLVTETDSMKTEVDGKRVALGVINDISEKTHIEKELREKVLFLNTLMEAMPFPIFCKDNNYRYIGCNRAFEELTGLKQNDIFGKSVFEIAPHHIAETYHQTDKLVFENQTSQRYEGQLQDKSEIIHDVVFCKAPFYDDEGRPAGLIGAVMDITEQKRIEKEIEQLSYQNQLILNAAGDGIFGMDTEGKMTFLNPAAEKILGWNSEELLGNHLHSLIHHTRANGQPCHSEECRIGLAIREGRVAYSLDDEVFWRNDRTSFPVKFVCTPIVEFEKIAGAVVVFQDITEQKKSEKKIQKTLAELEMFNRLSIGRELRMIELKKEINEIAAKAGTNPPYNLDFEQEQEGEVSRV